VYLGDIWPTSDEIQALLKYAMKGKAFRANYAKVARPSPASCGTRSRA
jgi:aconitate hydratase